MLDTGLRSDCVVRNGGRSMAFNDEETCMI